MSLQWPVPGRMAGQAPDTQEGSGSRPTRRPDGIETQGEAYENIFMLKYNFKVKSRSRNESSGRSSQRDFHVATALHRTQ